MKRFQSFRYAFAGIHYCFSTQLNFRIHLLLASLAILLGFLFGISNTEWLFIIVCIASVLCLEMMNSAIEKMCDLFHPGQHPQVKIIKDVAAGAVLAAAMASLVTGLVIFVPKLFQLINV